MKNDFKIYLVILAINILLLLLEVFILKISGVIGLTICILSVYFIVGSIIRLVKLSGFFRDEVMERLDILFFIWNLRKFILR